jgi:hypothetical protein
VQHEACAVAEPQAFAGAHAGDGGGVPGIRAPKENNGPDLVRLGGE